MFVCCECCVLSGRGLCDELITRLEESYRLWCVVVCDLKTSRIRRPWPALGRSATEKKYIYIHHTDYFFIIQLLLVSCSSPDFLYSAAPSLLFAFCLNNFTFLNYLNHFLYFSFISAWSFTLVLYVLFCFQMFALRLLLNSVWPEDLATPISLYIPH
jgi:hypothetical protein